MRGFRQIYNQYDISFSFLNLESFTLKLYDRIFRRVLKNYVLENNLVYKSFLKSRVAFAYRTYFSNLDWIHRVSLKYPRQNDDKKRQGDVLCVKPYIKKTKEKGVLIIHYTETLKKFASVYRLKKIAEKYKLVLEPSWWGYQDAIFLFYLNLPTEVFIECPYKSDFEFINSLGNNFYPLDIGAGDWVDSDLFSGSKSKNKIYDIVMVGNWSRIKRHKLLFRAISKMNNFHEIAIALIGYSSHNRTKEDILQEATKFNLKNQVTIFEWIKAKQVAEILSQSKVNVLLSKGEGANRGIYEGLFSGNVIVLNKYNKGVNKKIISENTGYFADDHNLTEVLEKAMMNYYNFDTRKWALSNTGYINSNIILNNSIKNTSLKTREKWTKNLVPKINVPNCLYKNESDRIGLYNEYYNLKKYLR